MTSRRGKETRLTPRLVAAAVEAACLLEVRAPKPGNVSRGRDRPGLRYRDYLASAQAIEPVFRRKSTGSVGRLVLEAVRATRRHAGTNTNLGIILLLAPLAKAALQHGQGGLRARLRRTLDDLTVQDARDAYAAIRLARPGGLGRVQEQDVRRSPTQDLLACMRLAADRDAVAREYATAFDTTFRAGVASLRMLRTWEIPLEAAIVETFLVLLATTPDSLIRRRHGDTKARKVSEMAASALLLGGTRSTLGRQAIRRLDEKLSGARPPMNPGTTADLLTAALFVWLLEGAAEKRKAAGGRGGRP